MSNIGSIIVIRDMIIIELAKIKKGDLKWQKEW
jgi:hypothetical protein